MAEKLSATFVKKSTRTGKFPDGGNLYLQVAESVRKDGSTVKTKSWAFRYSRFGKDTWLGLGPYPDVTLKAARDAALALRRKKHAGIDPLSDKQARQRAIRTEHENMLSFGDCAEKYVDSQAAGWSNPKHVAQWRSTLTNIAGPVIGHLPVDQVDTALVLRILEPIWTNKTETANRLRGRIESVLDWSTVRGYRKGDNPARWRGHLDKLLPRPTKVAKVKHHPALPYAETGAFMATLRKDEGIAARALEFTILTATRTAEVIQAEWSEFDFDAGMWIVPAERMKAKREHRVPLSPAAIKVLKSVEGHDKKYVFPGHKRGSHLSSGGMLAVLKRLKRSDITVHGFRSTFRDWCAESTSYPADVAEMALAHTLRDKTEAAYRRGDLFEKRARLMNDWAKYCGNTLTEATVTPIRGNHV